MSSSVGIRTSCLHRQRVICAEVWLRAKLVVVQQHRDVVGERVCRGDVEVAVAIQIARDASRTGRRGGRGEDRGRGEPAQSHNRARPAFTADEHRRQVACTRTRRRPRCRQRSGPRGGGFLARVGSQYQRGGQGRESQGPGDPTVDRCGGILPQVADCSFGSPCARGRPRGWAVRDSAGTRTSSPQRTSPARRMWPTGPVRGDSLDRTRFQSRPTCPRPNPIRRNHLSDRDRIPPFRRERQGSKSCARGYPYEDSHD